MSVGTFAMRLAHGTVASARPKIVADVTPRLAIQSRSLTTPASVTCRPILCHQTPTCACGGGFAKPIQRRMTARWLSGSVASFIEYCTTPKIVFRMTRPASSGVSSGLQTSMSEWTAVPPDVRRRSAMRRRFPTRSDGQPVARRMLPYGRMPGPMYFCLNSTSTSGLTATSAARTSSIRRSTPSETVLQSRPFQSSAKAGSSASTENASMKSSLSPSKSQSRTQRTYVSTRYRRTSGKRGSRTPTVLPQRKNLPLNRPYAADSTPTNGTDSQRRYFSMPAAWTASTCARKSGKRPFAGIQSPVAE